MNLKSQEGAVKVRKKFRTNTLDTRYSRSWRRRKRKMIAKKRSEKLE